MMRESTAPSGYFADHFGLDQDALRATLARALSQGGDFAEVFVQHKIGESIGFEDGQVNRASTTVDLGAGVRVLRGDQTGYAYSEDLHLRSLVAAAETASRIASGAASSAPERFNPVAVPSVYRREMVWLEVPAEQKIATVRQLGEKLLAGDASVVSATVSAQFDDEAVLIANSLGQVVEDIRPMVDLRCRCVAERDGRRETNSCRRGFRRGFDFCTGAELDALAAETLRRTLLLFEATSAPAGEMTVVLAPGTSGILLHEAMGHGFEADFNRKNISIFSKQMGQPIAADFVTIVDSGLERESRGSLGVDDEGTPGQRTVLVDRGRLVSYLHDRISAGHYGVAPTGNGRRQDFRHVPIPRMRTTFMENGPHDPEEIIRSVKRGLYAEHFSNGQVMIGAGDYSFYLRSGYLIEDGKLARPVKDANLIGNGPDTLRKIVMAGNDAALGGDAGTCGKDGQWVPVGTGLPTCKVSSITVGGVNA